jgi:hypothetical protein
VSRKRERRRALLSDPAEAQPATVHEIKLIRFGSPRQPADRCTYMDAPAEFALCLDCSYNRGAQGSGIRCAHRFGLDPTLVDGRPTQFSEGEIVPLDE